MVFAMDTRPSGGEDFGIRLLKPRPSNLMDDGARVSSDWWSEFSTVAIKREVACFTPIRNTKYINIVKLYAIVLIS